jgi:hypothetical protein
MHTDIDKRPKVGNVSNRARYYHTRLKVLFIENIGQKHRLWKFILGSRPVLTFFTISLSVGAPNTIFAAISAIPLLLMLPEFRLFYLLYFILM